MGLNITELRQNLEKYFKKKEKLFLKDSVLKMSNLLINKRYKNIILLNYAPELEKFLYWYQQLIAESLGKNTKGFLQLYQARLKIIIAYYNCILMDQKINYFISLVPK